jgi:hypothetical protein
MITNKSEDEKNWQNALNVEKKLKQQRKHGRWQANRTKKEKEPN